MYNQKEYFKTWRKANLKKVVYELDKELVEKFKEACLKQQISQLSVIKKAMVETIKKTLATKD